MNPTNYQVSDNQPADVHISHPYSLGPTTDNFAYQPYHGEPNVFNAYHHTDQSTVASSLFQTGNHQPTFSGNPQICTPAQLCALPGPSVSSVPAHRSGLERLPSQPQGHSTSTQILATLPSSQPPLSDLYLEQTTKSGPRGTLDQDQYHSCQPYEIGDHECKV